jgi:hypothetical protein
VKSSFNAPRRRASSVTALLLSVALLLAGAVPAGAVASREGAAPAGTLGATSLMAAALAPAGALDIANAVATDPSQITSATYDAVPGGTPNGVSDSPISSFPTDGATFGILTSGDVNFATLPNDAGNTGADLGGPNVWGDTDFDVTILNIGLEAPIGANCLVLDFAFYSEEFPEWVNTQYNDAFIAELDSSTWTTSGSDILAPDNFAFDPANNPISINAAGNTSMNAANAAGTTYDGATPLLSAATPITPGAHNLYLSLFDQGDRIYDSAVFLDNLRVGFVPDPEINCVPGAQPVNFQIDLDPANAVNHVGTPHTVTATLLETDGTPVAGAEVDFEVTGTHSDSGSATTDGAGQAEFTYTGTQVGVDTITAGYDADGDGAFEAVASASKEWTNAPPECSQAAANPAALWPPNHKMVPVTIGGVTDPDGDPVTITVDGVTQDEPTNGLGDGDTAPDAEIGGGDVSVRAERSGKGDGRVYVISFTADDGLGGACQGTVTVTVPHDQRPGGAAVDSGQAFDSTV